jgi:glycosyltransferase involved in cell wall biosynthesis
LKTRNIWHIYHSTRGAAGAYINALQKAMSEGGIRSYAFVSRNYIFDTSGIIKYFFPLTDFTEKRNKLIRATRGAELIVGYFFIWLAASMMRPTICLHLAGFHGGMNTLFRAFKLVGLRVYLTCHDVTENNLEMSEQRLYMLLNADKLIVHSSAAASILRKNLGETATKRIVQYSFPFSSYDSILVPEKKFQAVKTLQKELNGNNADYFLFIGGIKKSKGIETLIEAWKIAACRKKFKLLIAGKWDGGDSMALLSQAKELENCVVLNRYLTNEEFVCFIENAKFSILPYNDYSHSSVLISCAKRNGAVIISDIDLFKEFLRNYDLTFPKGDAKTLAAVLEKAAQMPENEVKLRAELLKKSVEQDDRKLIQEVIRAYNEP